MVFQVCRASDSFMDQSKVSMYSPYRGAIWDAVGQCWTLHMATPGAIVKLKEELNIPIRVDGEMPFPRIVIEDLN